jgi:hypothetical protein
MIHRFSKYLLKSFTKSRLNTKKENNQLNLIRYDQYFPDGSRTNKDNDGIVSKRDFAFKEKKWTD